MVGVVEEFIGGIQMLRDEPAADMQNEHLLLYFSLLRTLADPSVSFVNNYKTKISNNV